MQCDPSHAQILQMPVVLHLTWSLPIYLGCPLREANLQSELLLLLIRQSASVRLLRQITMGQLGLEVTPRWPSACRWRSTTTRR